MSAILAKALKVRMPHDFDRAQNDFGVQPLSSTATSAATALPYEWSGRFVLIYIPTGGVDVFFACSKIPNNPGTPHTLAAIEVDRAAAASTTFPVLKTGLPLPAGQLHQLMLPQWDKNETGYLVYESGSTQTFYLALGDGA
jgi:hypothetical protein